MSSTMTTTRSPSLSTSKSDKGKKVSKKIVLRLSPKLLARFIEKTAEEEPQSPSESGTSAALANGTPHLKLEASVDAASESNSTPAPTTETTIDGDPTKKRKGPAPGTKRNVALMEDGQPKPRGKPGPKKKPRLEDGTIDHSAKPAHPTGAAHRLGPKAAEKAINAGLRALDRSGAPCRRWSRKSFQVKSFTGVSWGIPSWRGGERVKSMTGDSSSEVRETSQQSNSDAKPPDSDVAMDSTIGDPMAVSTPMASSPPAAPEHPIAITA